METGEAKENMGFNEPGLKNSSHLICDKPSFKIICQVSDFFQSESAELRQKLRIAESSAEDLESRLTAANQQKLSAEASKSEVVTKLKDAKARLEQVADKSATLFAWSIIGIRAKVQSGL